MTLTPDDLATLRRLADEATRAPWDAREGRNLRPVLVAPEQAAEVGVVSTFLPNARFAEELREASWINARFIAAARNHLPALLDALERAEAEAAALREALVLCLDQGYHTKFCRLYQDIGACDCYYNRAAAALKDGE